MKYLTFLFFIVLFFNACSLKQVDKPKTQSKVEKLTLMISNSSSNININEAKIVSEKLISHSLLLSKNYKVNTSALIHNTLINLDFKKRGLCYHYARDLIKFINPKEYKSFEIKKIVANRGEYFEHTALLLTRNDISFQDSIVLDAWRNTGDLYFSKIVNDKRYEWELK